ncbi:MAG TPA: hypothetical protein VL549_03245 [Gemmatimonadales bacterium]|nr:hypothetical protein [Gemmatimonadales bacterium]
MLAAFIVTAATVLQVAGNPHIARSARAIETPPSPVRVWREDSIAYVTLRQPGHLLLLNIDMGGRITVVFPLGPFDATDVDANVAFAVPLPPEAQGNPATLVAVRSRWGFDFAALGGGAGGTWNYQDAWLLQPTAGDPLGAVLDIADRVTAGRPYDYGGVKYARDGSLLALGAPVAPDVCLSCVRRAPAVETAAATATNAVDCSNASMTNSFCGVNSGSVSITSIPPTPQIVYQQAPAPAVAPVYVPYFLPISRGFRRRFEPAPMPAPMMSSQGVAYPIAPRLVVPSTGQIGTFVGRRH